MLPLMDPSDRETEHNHTDVSTVQSQRNDLTAEEFPEGPYGASIESESLGKSTPWRKGQHGPRPFGNENLQLHQGLERNYPGEDLMTEESQRERIEDE